MSRAKRGFVDTIRLFVNGGSGGMGLPKYKGVGGRGGSVYLEVRKDQTLIGVINRFSKRIVTAEKGETSKTMKIFGEPGKDIIVGVPEGVIIYDEFMRKIGELNKIGDKLLVAEGGPGGSPNSKPPYSGAKGRSQTITIDLKLIADVGLVGFPNAGKSTLLTAVSRAKPKIAAYSFTTLKPNIGIICYPDFREIKMADLPGLIEGASDNLGMGHRFLKHVERSSLLLLLVDINGFQLTPSHKHRSCLETVFILNKELELYKKELLDKPAILAINKMDLQGASEAYSDIVHALKNLPDYVSKVPEEIRPEKMLTFDYILPISAKCDMESVEVLKKHIRESIDVHFENSIKDEVTEKQAKLLKKIKLQNTEINEVTA